MFKLEYIYFSFDRRDATPLLCNCSLHIPRGAMLAIMGLNGMGKTTLLKIMSGTLKPLSGSVHIDGANAKGLSNKTLAKSVSHVPQDFPTDFPFTVFDFVMMGRFVWQRGLFNSREDRDKVHAALQNLKLDHLKDRPISQLSGGERQRTLLARALVQDSRAILLDEPSNHLDIKNKTGILNIIRDQNQKHQKTIIAVMHDFYDVKKYFDQVLFIKDGQIKYYGPVVQGFEKALLKDVFEMDVTEALSFCKSLG
ncbi:MAG: ABC transporter ATP-binding protein [Deltaproteobacteria bacterium]|nr:ABC transporter ATP-binding protein [Deltaproteobacteria bacterium]